MNAFLKTLSRTACCIALMTLGSAQAHAGNMAIDPAGIKVSKSGDLEMDCHQLSNEVSVMEDIALETQEIQDSSRLTDTGLGVAKAVGSYLVGSFVGGLGIIAAGYIVSEVADDKAETAAVLQDTAMQRRSFMAGIYNAKGCLGPLELIRIEPAAGDENEESFIKPRVREQYSFNN